MGLVRMETRDTNHAPQANWTEIAQTVSKQSLPKSLHQLLRLQRTHGGSYQLQGFEHSHVSWVNLQAFLAVAHVRKWLTGANNLQLCYILPGFSEGLPQQPAQHVRSGQKLQSLHAAMLD